MSGRWPGRRATPGSSPRSMPKRRFPRRWLRRSQRRGKRRFGIDLGDEPGVALLPGQRPDMFQENVDGLDGQRLRKGIACLIADGDDDLFLAGEVPVYGSVGKPGL